MSKYKFRKSFTFGGKRYNVFGNTEKEVLFKMFEKQKTLEEGLVSGNTTVAEWTETALATYKAGTKNIENTRLRLKKHVFSAIGDRQLKSIRPLDLQNIMNAQTGMSFSHVQKLKQELQFIFRTAKQNKLIADNPAEDIILPRSRKGSRQALSEDERTAFLKACENTDKFRIFELMFYCGCHPAEAAECRREDITVKNGIPLLHIRGTKTINSDRYVPMPHDLYAVFEPLAARALLAPCGSGNKYTLSSYNRRSANLKREMNIAMGCKVYRNALLPPYPLRESFVPYELRHTYCTDLARRGIDVRVAQKLMGHSTISITADIYTHVNQEQILANAYKILVYQNLNNLTNR